MKVRAILIAFALVLPSAAGARVDSIAFPQLAFRQHPGAQLPLDAQLTNEAGRAVSLGNALQGRPAILVLEYLRCRSLCSLVLAGAVNAMQQAQLAPGKRLQLVAVSIDPRDTSSDAAAARARYAAYFADPAGAGQGMHFLTASPKEVARIASAVGFPYRYNKDSGQFAHPAGFVVVTPSGTISRYMLGLNPDSALLRQAVKEAAQGSVEPPAHPLLLLCFGYDPDEGTAAALAMRLVRWVSIAAVLGCAALIGFLSLRRRAA